MKLLLFLDFLRVSWKYYYYVGKLEKIRDSTLTSLYYLPEPKNQPEVKAIWSSQFFKNLSFPSHVCGFLDFPVDTGTFQSLYSSQNHFLDFPLRLLLCLLFSQTDNFLPREKQFVHLPFNGFRENTLCSPSALSFKLGEKKGSPLHQPFRENEARSKRQTTFLWKRSILLLPEAGTPTRNIGCHL